MINFKICYGQFLKVMSSIVGVDIVKNFDAQLRFQRKLNMKRPKTLADKVSFLELHDQSPLAPMCSDKYAVREYVAFKGLDDILVPLVGGPWEKVEDVDFSKLPSSYAIKATHGCKMNYIVPNKAKMDVGLCQKEMKRWLATTYGTYSMEPHYTKIPHRIYAEMFLENMNQLTDYKFHCLNGVPQFVLVCSNRKSSGDKRMQVTLDLFDMQWNPIFELCPNGAEIPGNGVLKRPIMFDNMCQIAEVLSKDFKFVRVDLYEIDKKIYFGELTFSPSCCVFPYFTDKFNEEMGRNLTL